MIIPVPRSFVKKALSLIAASFLCFGVSLAQLKHTDRQADYIVITPSAFEETVREFTQWRTLKGLQTVTVTVENIYAEFQSAGMSKQDAIREFLNYVFQNWKQPSPRYVLLAGGTDFIPSFRVYTPDFKTLGEDSVTTDALFLLDKSINIRANVALGRFPAADSRQLQAMITKTRQFEESNGRNSYRYDMSIVNFNDSTDANIFEAFARMFRFDVLPSRFAVNTVSYKYTEPKTKAKAEVADAMNTGSVFLSYYGHGSPQIWGKAKVFTSEDADSLLKQTRKPFIFTTAACSQRFDVPNSILEKLLAFEEGGAVVSLASTGIVWLDQSAEFVKKFYAEVLSNASTRAKTVGEAFLASKKEPYGLFAGEGGDTDWRRFNLLGDPALALPQQLATTSAYDAPALVSAPFGSAASPNPFADYARIRFTLPKSSEVTLKVFNALGQVIFAADGVRYNAGENVIAVDLSSYPQGTYFYYLSAGEAIEKGSMRLVR